MKNLFLSAMLILASFNAFSQEFQDTGLITIESAKAQLNFLASDELQGRRAGHPGGYVAAQYILSCLSEIGIQPLFEGEYFQAFEKVKEVEIQGKKQFFHFKMKNIAGYIPGKNKDQYVLVGAHYDHLGISNPIDGDSIYNGADDNASGVVAVLQLAKTFAVSGSQPDKTLIFAFWDGEEIGLLGSEYFVNNFSGINDVKAYMNFDMVGRNHREDQPGLFFFLYNSGYTEAEKWVKESVHSFGLKLLPEFRPMDNPAAGSDNASFARKGIPIVWYHTDAHPDYHKPGDEAYKINWEKMTDIIRSAYYVLYKICNAESID